MNVFENLEKWISDQGYYFLEKKKEFKLKKVHITICFEGLPYMISIKAINENGEVFDTYHYFNEYNG